MRPSSPLLDSVRDQFEDYDQLAKDFTRVFLNMEPSCLQNAQLFDVVFLVGQSKQKARFIGVRAILGVRSRVFQVNDCEWILQNYRYTFNIIIQLFVHSIEIHRKCCMAFRRVSVHHRYQLLSYLHGRHQLWCHRKVAINVRRVRISFKCRTSNRRVRRVFHHRQWLSVHSHA